MLNENTQVTGKLKGIEDDGIIIVTDEGKKFFLLEKNVLKHLLGKMLKKVTVQISNDIVIGLLDDERSSQPLQVCKTKY